ncbi:deoxyguanosinetriphosphate triphosphohydrolase [Methylotuvimicrobium sp. KM1]|uniref:deoxyguanosinetriphosphate triphosphohydrolase n=1 Tax=Methylotuvimicrobium sp. KM1 TaxID=3377707 RepID=UPI00384F84E7
MKMEWEKLLSKKRLNKPEESKTLDVRSEFHKDYDRIVFSSAFRRLGRKTQVHPLSNHDHIHTRLTHSIEVGSVGRSLGHNVGVFLEGNNHLPKDISAQEIGAIVQAACLAHDIGNPPFGHAGEYAIRHWFKENGWKLALELDSERNDFEIFEGNAQGFRVVASIENNYQDGGLKLTYATLGTLIKYPWFSGHELAKSKGKFNFFQSEKTIAQDLMSELGLESSNSHQFRRHPLSYLMEAADDICYKILDIEDALELNILRFDDVSTILNNLAGNKEEYCGESSDDFRVWRLRSTAIDNLIKKVTEIFKSNYDEIISGNFKGDLISRIDGIEAEGINNAKKVTRENIFLNRRKIELELGSYETLDRILTAFVEAANEVKKEQVSFKSQRVMDLMGVNKFTKGMSYHECYLRITDMVSSMTDNHATHVANQLLGRAL